MFRILFVTLIALRVIACPVFCAAGAEGASKSGVQPVCACHCGHQEATPCDGDDEQWPVDEDSCPCDGGCILQVTPDEGCRSVIDDLRLSIDSLPLRLESLDLRLVQVNRCVERNPQRFDLQCGRDVRLVYASLLL